jgi:hypothetical protein
MIEMRHIKQMIKIRPCIVALWLGFALGLFGHIWHYQWQFYAILIPTIAIITCPFRFFASKYEGYDWIKVKRYEMDESKTWEDRYRALEKHHVKETEFLINKLRDEN